MKCKLEIYLNNQSLFFSPQSWSMVVILLLYLCVILFNFCAWFSVSEKVWLMFGNYIVIGCGYWWGQWLCPFLRATLVKRANMATAYHRGSFTFFSLSQPATPVSRLFFVNVFSCLVVLGLKAVWFFSFS